MNIWIQTLGCDKNTADSSSLAGLLRQAGGIIVDRPQEADLVVVNTCGFILPAKEESIGALLQAVSWKEEKPALKVVAVGCLVQKYMEELQQEIPELDGFFGVHDLEGILEVIEETTSGRKTAQRGPAQLQGDRSFPQRAEGVSAYLKIADGCDTCCTYCAIPSIKGGYVSRRPEVLLREARELASQGVQELILVAQDTTRYGCDLPEEYGLGDLLEELAEIAEFHWIRILYAYPDHMTQELLRTMGRREQICSYLDIPFQHADDQILRRMGRRQTRQSLLDLLKLVRREIPGISLRSTMITGFPGEDEQAFEQLLSFLEEAKLDWVGAFIYSQEEGTPASRFRDQVSEEIKQDRYDRLMAQQQRITAEKLEAQVGQTLEVLLEEECETGLWQGRTQGMAPDVDGVVWVRTEADLTVGQFIPVHILEAHDYDLMGEYR